MTYLLNMVLKHYRIISYWAFAILAGGALIALESMEDSEPTFSILTFFYFALLIFFGVRWIIGQIKSTLVVKREKTNIELKHLQSQINPHFFFNILNNLYGLIEKDKDNARQMVLKLSDMMRYSIYEGQQEKVTIKEELTYLKNYLELHRMRYHKAIDVRFEEAIENEEAEILPLLFINLLENAFKHGVENIRTGAFVHLKLIALDDTVFFEVKNNFDPETVNDQNGIGLKNIKRRLEIAYPGKHIYSFSNKENIYVAKLKLQLK